MRVIREHKARVPRASPAARRESVLIPVPQRPASVPDDGHFVMIPLTQGKFALVNEADAGFIVGTGPWHAIRGPHTWYAAHGSPRIYMHALIANHKGVDHVNRNGLDNRRINLRAATQSQNNANKRPGVANTSGYKGVSWTRRARKWKVQIGTGADRRYLGLFDDPAEAARAYNAAAIEMWGEFAWLNPVPPQDDVA